MTAQRYKDIKSHGSPELLNQVKNGEIKINTAHRKLGKEIIKQLNKADKIYDYLEKNLKTIEPGSEEEKLLRSILSQLESLKLKCLRK